MERFYAFANWSYRNWLPIFAIPFGLIVLVAFAYKFVTAPSPDVAWAKKLERERLSADMIEEIKAFELPPSTKLVELGEHTKWKDHIYISARYETELPMDTFLENSNSMLDSRGWRLYKRTNDRGLDTQAFCRKNLYLHLTFHPPGIFRSDKIGRWSMTVGSLSRLDLTRGNEKVLPGCWVAE